MSEFFDLHVHTTYSDGNQSVAEVVELAALIHEAPASIPIVSMVQV